MSPRTLPLAIVAVLLAETGAHAVSAEAHASVATPSSTPAPYELKQRSSFHSPPEGQRAPFWPIGWTKRRSGQLAQTPSVVAPKFALDEKSFKVTSILIGNPSLAIINGRTYMEGELLRQSRAASGAPAVATSTSTLPPNARIRVFRINDGQVVLQYHDQSISVGLQRPELAQKPDQDLLSEDRP